MAQGKPVTEFVVIPLKSGVDVTPGTEDHKIFSKSSNVISSQPGNQRIVWGSKVEDSNQLIMAIDWDSHEHHMAFIKDPCYAPFLEEFGAIIGGAPEILHFHLSPHPPRAALTDTTSPATEVLSMYFPVTLSQAEKDRISGDLATFGSKVKGIRGFANGWLVEESVDYEKGPDGKAIVHRAVIGWDSVDAHIAARETQEFKDNAHLIRKAPGVLGMDVYHFRAKEF